jgi:heme exporter protein A
MSLHFEARGLKKVFNRRVIFQNISFVLHERQTLLVTGRNGSGKSTLVKILSDVLSPTEGTVLLKHGSDAAVGKRVDWIGLVSPYLQLYDEFSAEENLRLACAMRGLRWNDGEIHALLKKVFLYERRNDPVRTYSSGMKQRMKYAFALIHRPPILILDEPTSNLDAEGIRMVKDIMSEQQQQGILIVATNDLTDLDTYDLQVDLNVAH